MFNIAELIKSQLDGMIFKFKTKFSWTGYQNKKKPKRRDPKKNLLKDWK